MNYLKNVLLIIITIAFTCPITFAQEDSVMIRTIFDKALNEGKAYEALTELCKDIGGRLSGSQEADQAVIWGKEKLETFGLAPVYLQEVMVPKWTRGEREVAYYTVKGSKKPSDLAVCALGGSVSTGKKGIMAEVVEVKSLTELKELGEDKIKGKIVFYNRPMRATLISTFRAYGGAVGQRVNGAKEASKYGAIAVVVRSMSLKIDNEPHTGVMRYGDAETKIPAAAVSTLGAENLSKALKANPNLKMHLRMTCKNHEDVLSHNVIGEIKGSEYPDKYIVIGAHLDSWDLGEGAHDDGAGIVHVAEAARLLIAAGYQPKHTIRVVFYMNEENGLAGGKKYAEEASNKNEKHLVAIESDSGGFTPRGFGADAPKEFVEMLQGHAALFEDYGLNYFGKGYGGADIGPLKEKMETPLIGYIPDSQRYFDYHHARTDVLEMVNERELAMGAASIAALVYLLDKYEAQ